MISLFACCWKCVQGFSNNNACFHQHKLDWMSKYFNAWRCLLLFFLTWYQLWNFSFVKKMNTCKQERTVNELNLLPLSIFLYFLKKCSIKFMKMFKSRLKSLKTRLNVFLNVFTWEGEMMMMMRKRARAGCRYRHVGEEFYRCICLLFSWLQLCVWGGGRK